MSRRTPLSRPRTTLRSREPLAIHQPSPLRTASRRLVLGRDAPALCPNSCQPSATGVDVGVMRAASSRHPRGACSMASAPSQVKPPIMAEDTRNPRVAAIRLMVFPFALLSP